MPDETTMLALIEALRREVQAGFEGVHGRLDQLNNRTRQAEVAIAVLQDRSVRDPAARWGAIGAFLTALLGAFWSLVEGWRR